MVHHGQRSLRLSDHNPGIASSPKYTRAIVCSTHFVALHRGWRYIGFDCTTTRSAKPLRYSPQRDKQITPLTSDTLNANEMLKVLAATPAAFCQTLLLCPQNWSASL